MEKYSLLTIIVISLVLINALLVILSAIDPNLFTMSLSLFGVVINLYFNLIILHYQNQFATQQYKQKFKLCHQMLKTLCYKLAILQGSQKVFLL